jgi:hypothetical protein
MHWRSALPPELHTETVADWSTENVWVLVLKAMSYRLECVFYRNLREVLGAGEDESRRRALQKQQGAMLEFDAILDRVMLHSLVEFCPLALYVLCPLHTRPRAREIDIASGRHVLRS